MSLYAARHFSSSLHTCSFRKSGRITDSRNFLLMLSHSETRRQTLEEIAAAFGDQVVDSESGKAVGSRKGSKTDVEHSATSIQHREVQ